jgi:hypothetical protein
MKTENASFLALQFMVFLRASVSLWQIINQEFIRWK